jgi:Tfp pilus assembly protein PilW
MKKTLGFSLVELLIAGAILGIVLTVLTNLFVSSRRASEHVDEVSDQQQEAHATRQVLQYEIGLAGYRGILNTGSGSTLLANRTFGASSTIKCPTTVTVCTISMTHRTSSAQPDTLTVRYYEDRNYNGSETPVLRTVTYSIGSDAGVSSLFRQQDLGTAVAIIPNITNLKIAECKYPDSEPNHIIACTNNRNDLVGLELNITYANQQTDTLLVTFQNAQTVSVTNQ